MQFLNSLLIVSSYILFIIPHCQGNCDEPGDAPSCTNEELYGEGKNCIFAFAQDISPKEMKNFSRGTAQLFLKGCLHNYKLDFAVNHKRPEYPLTTIVPENDKVVWGYTYLIDTDFYQKKMMPLVTKDEGVRIMRSVKVSIEVTMEGEKKNIDCNAFMAVYPPQKEKCIPLERQPSESLICWFAEIFTAAHFPTEYIEEVCNIPKHFCKCTNKN